MLVKIQLSEEEYTYLNLSQIVTIWFFKENYAYKMNISSINSSYTYRFENEDFYFKAQDLIDEYILHPLEVEDEDPYNIKQYDVKFKED